MIAGFVPGFAGWGRLDLSALNSRAALLDRAEQKYVMTAAVMTTVLDELRDAFDVLSIDDREIFTYETVYYDTDSLLAYRQHVQGKRRRSKIRSRRYVESDLYFFEVKMKGGRGRTVKERMPYDARRHGTVGPDAQSFVQECLQHAYGEVFLDEIVPQLAVRYRRVTLVGKGAPERVTVDFDFEFTGGDQGPVLAPPETLIVEVKSENGRGVADAYLRRAGGRPASCSKYCVGLNLLRPGLVYNRFKPVLVHHFDWRPAEQVA